jgi:hypothetical protein
MINANDWLQKRVETIFDNVSATECAQVMASSSIWHRSQKGQCGPNAKISGRIDAFAFVRKSLVPENGFWSGFIHRRERSHFCRI